MTATIQGLHHVTAISGDARRNVDFYTRVLGLRFVKKTVNFDDPTVYHLYYGNETGAPGTALTFFPWEHLGQGRGGVGEVSVTHYAVPQGSLPFWRTRLEGAGRPIAGPRPAFEEPRLVFEDPDGLKGALVETAEDDRLPWTTGGIVEDVAIRGFHGVTLTLDDAAPSAELLTGLMDYEAADREDNRQRFLSRQSRTARVVDIEVLRGGQRALQGAGSVHHVAFSVADKAAQAEVRQRLNAAGVPTTPQIDRNYFFSIYFRSPGGVLFEVATEEPGFTVDEPVAELGRSLRLPAQHEHLRADLERMLPPLGV
jgi:glyoxalase family protein